MNLAISGHSKRRGPSTKWLMQLSRPDHGLIKNVCDPQTHLSVDWINTHWNLLTIAWNKLNRFDHSKICCNAVSLWNQDNQKSPVESDSESEPSEEALKLRTLWTLCTLWKLCVWYHSFSRWTFGGPKTDGPPVSLECSASTENLTICIGSERWGILRGRRDVTDVVFFFNGLERLVPEIVQWLWT